MTGSIPRILVVDDEPAVRSIIAEVLTREGMHVTEAADGTRALELVATMRPDLVVLDLGLPRLPGLEVLRRLRAEGEIPVIVLTGQDSEADRIVGLELGADDYVTKPFSPREVAARVKRVLHRSAGRPVATAPLHDFGDLVIDESTREVFVAATPVELTRLEFDLLVHLASAPRQVFSAEQILRDVWRTEPGWQRTSTVAEHVYRLRTKLGHGPTGRDWIQTVRGVGYRFVADRPAEPDPQGVGALE